MTFDKNVLFLGMREMSFQDGRKMYALELFAEGEGSIKVNVGENSADALAVLRSCSFGNVLHCRFRLREQDKLYRLQLEKVAKDGK